MLIYDPSVCLLVLVDALLREGKKFFGYIVGKFIYLDSKEELYFINLLAHIIWVPDMCTSKILDVLGERVLGQRICTLDCVSSYDKPITCCDNLKPQYLTSLNLQKRRGKELRRNWMKTLRLTYSTPSKVTTPNCDISCSVISTLTPKILSDQIWVVGYLGNL